MSELEQLPLRVPAPLKRRLERLAEADGRSLNNYATRALEAHVAAERAPENVRGRGTSAGRSRGTR